MTVILKIISQSDVEHMMLLIKIITLVLNLKVSTYKITSITARHIGLTEILVMFVSTLETAVNIPGLYKYICVCVITVDA